MRGRDGGFAKRLYLYWRMQFLLEGFQLKGLYLMAITKGADEGEKAKASVYFAISLNLVDIFMLLNGSLLDEERKDDDGRVGQKV